MAVALDAVLGTGNSDVVATTSLTTGAAVAAGATVILLVGRWHGSSSATVSVTGTGGLTWTADHNLSSGNLRIYVFRALAASGLASGTTLTVTHSNTAGGLGCVIGAVSYTGIDTVGTVTAFNGVGASTAAWSSNSVAGNSGDALIGGAFVDAAGVSSSTPGGSAVERFDRNVPAQTETLVFEDILSIAGTTALTGTWNAAATHIAIAVAYKATAGGGGTVVKQLATLGVG